MFANGPINTPSLITELLITELLISQFFPITLSSIQLPGFITVPDDTLVLP